VFGVLWKPVVSRRFGRVDDFAVTEWRSELDLEAAGDRLLFALGACAVRVCPGEFALDEVCFDGSQRSRSR
jgi:hypothetical protein